jgi:hypothetical protein
MKIIAVCHADFDCTPLGTPARLEADLHGTAVLRRTLMRVRTARRVASVHLLVPASQRQRAEAAVAGLDVQVETHEADAVPWQSYVASARKWSLDAWRGGLGSTSVFDETLHPWLLGSLAQRESADGVVDVPAGAALLDCDLLDAMIAHYEQVHEQVRMTFTQAPPGLATAIYAPGLLNDLGEANHWPGRMMAYQPAKPARDMIMLPCFYPPPFEVRTAVGRCIADTHSAVERMASILQAAGNAASNGRSPDASAVARWLTASAVQRVGELPSEVEIELTTEDPLPDSTLRPRGLAIERHGAMPQAVFDAIIDELATRDDARVVLGGFGDPLLADNFARCLRKCRDAGIFGLAVRTPAVHLSDEAFDALLDARVDVVNVLLDAATPETYRRVHLADCFERVTANIDRLLAAHADRQQPQPLVVCEMTKTADTLAEMEAFFDHWVARTGSAIVVGPSTYGGQWPNRAVMDMTPPLRSACRRVFARTMILADGRMTLCDQDFRGRHAVGTVTESSVSDLWRSPSLNDIRHAHRSSDWTACTLCPPCLQWHQP